MPSLEQHRGYLVIDHTNSPGIPVDLAEKWRARGIPVAMAGEKLELDTYTCAHCSAIVIKRPERTRERAVCRNCMRVVCDQHSLWCEPFARLADAVADGKFHVLPSSPLIVPTRA